MSLERAETRGPAGELAAGKQHKPTGPAPAQTPRETTVERRHLPAQAQKVRSHQPTQHCLTSMCQSCPRLWE